MTKRYPFGSALCSGNSGNTRNLQRIAFGRLAPADLPQRGRADADESARERFTLRHSFRANVYHAHCSALAEMSQLLHRVLRRGSTKAISPASQFSLSGDTTRNALDFETVTTSPEPCHGRTLTSGSLPG